ncbi:MAG: hypothetical protein BGO55_22925 [Sphingobacteriales bacterium 50-39]|nr:carboxypeptidase-like regulatory domain-containing protein [Sphingobacteriales bacterium]OJW58166.1 MAG: hypothetical protein BGO55_22925 [Sphingobacteriales bacterium 50-39]
MLKNVQLSIKNPCSESWDRMTPEEQGRFCASCQKLVIDFTSMDDQEVLQWFTLPKGSVCGRFRQDQLRRSLVATLEKKRSKWRYWHYLVAGLLFSSEISAQSDPHRPPIGQHISPGERNRLLIGDTTATSAPGFSQDYVRGKVMDGNGNPLPGATVMFGPRKGVVTDEQGYFSIASKTVPAGASLIISYVGFVTITTPADKFRVDGQQQAYRIVTMTAAETQGLVVIAGRVSAHKSKRDTLTLVKDTLACIGLGKKALTVYPNPIARGNSITITARLDQLGIYIVQLFSISGSLLETQEVPGGQKSGNISMNIPATLTPGAYVVRLSNSTAGKSYTQQVVVY